MTFFPKCILPPLALCSGNGDGEVGDDDGEVALAVRLRPNKGQIARKSRVRLDKRNSSPNKVTGAQIDTLATLSLTMLDGEDDDGAPKLDVEAGIDDPSALFDNDETVEDVSHDQDLVVAPSPLKIRLRLPTAASATTATSNMVTTRRASASGSEYHQSDTASASDGDSSVSAATPTSSVSHPESICLSRLVARRNNSWNILSQLTTNKVDERSKKALGQYWTH